MKDWLTVIVVLLIVGILLDGWRRMRLASKDNIRVSKRARKFDSRGTDDEHLYPSELPNGGARVIAKRPVHGNSSHQQKQTSRVENTASTKSGQIPQQVSLNLDESVPMLMESVEPQQKAEAESAEAHVESAFESSTGAIADERVEPKFSALDETEFAADEPVFSEPQEEAPAQPDEVIIINVMAREGTQFAGDQLLDVLLQCGMRYGEMNIFHRHAQDSGDGPVQFSLANMVQPGTFDLDGMDNFTTPGVSLFLTLPMRSDSIKAFDNMRYTAQTVAETLSGELKDEQRSVMTRQTMEHCRQRIAEYERKRLSRASH
ncbi:cell division protein ZipA [Gilvimarinus sp. SDUM040013]|uniref:Cell division protein ZipA n=1 Tax=Gilvimarinus gilvus TaxID=3058038 RepID=A0ABU4RYQ3_9GAMM|nr:cell division protein ZipA [Gilvimarinus sp. SDUM040013]MDO3385586.1 cell division protein ZipA [Gilvimarinus sp. SDUM040013]MDX6849920.1 cell division protein ZipA [Gilvimarinus sp. SDUM040013]